MPTCSIAFSWKGIRGFRVKDFDDYGIDYTRLEHAYVEWDLMSGAAGEISLARDELRLSREIRRAVEEIQAHVMTLVGKFVEATSAGKLDALNFALAGRVLPPQRPFFWFADHLNRARHVKLQPREFPMVSFGWRYSLPANLQWQGRTISPTRPMDAGLNNEVHEPLDGGHHRVVFYKHDPTRMALLRESRAGPQDGMLVFPSTWPALLCAHFRGEKSLE